MVVLEQVSQPMALISLFCCLYQLGGRILDYTYQGLMDVAATGSALHKDMLKAWTLKIKNTDVPRMNINDQYTNRLTDRFLTSSGLFKFAEYYIGLYFAKESDT